MSKIDWPDSLIEEQLRVCEAATQGPWEVEMDEDGIATIYHHPANEPKGPFGARGHGLNLFGRLVPDLNGLNNIGWMLEARSHYESALRELRVLRRTLEVLADGPCDPEDVTDCEEQARKEQP